MRGNEGHWIDRAVAHGVAALFALACAFPGLTLAADVGAAAVGGAGLCALLGYAAAMRLLAAPRPCALEFPLVPLPTAEDMPELLLDTPAPAGIDAVADAIRAVDAPPPGGMIDDQARLSEALDRLRRRLA